MCEVVRSCSFKVEKNFFWKFMPGRTIYRWVSELQTFVYVAVTKEFTMISGLQKNTFGKNYTLVDSQIHGEYNKQRLNSVYNCISKL